MAAMSCNWEGNRRSGIALAMRHRLKRSIHLRALMCTPSNACFLRPRACLDQLLIAIRSFTLLCDQSRSQARLITIMKLIAKLGIIYATACHASLCTAALDCLSVSCHCHLLLYTNMARGGGGGN